MTGCSAINCSNSSDNGAKMYRFPTNVSRRAQWLNNCRRKNWTPTPNHRLCEKHFEESQFFVAPDGSKHLAGDAVPTIFDLTNPSSSVSSRRKSVCQMSVKKEDTNSSTPFLSLSSVSSSSCLSPQLSSSSSPFLPSLPSTLSSPKEIQDLIIKLRLENIKLRNQLEEKNIMLTALKTSFNEDQLANLVGKKCIWTHDTLIKSLKLRFCLGIRGYNFLRSTKYPLPGYSTLTEHIRKFRINFGVFHDLMKLLKYKVETLQPADRFCVLALDEMAICPGGECNKNTKSFLGKVTLGKNTSEEGSHMLVVLVRGIKGTWKQIIGAHCTNYSISGDDMKNFIEECIICVEQCGLYVHVVSSDMGRSNRNLWKSWGVGVKKNGRRKNSFIFNGHTIYITPDVSHLLRTLKTTIMRTDVLLPESYVQFHNLPSNIVSLEPVLKLWKAEITVENEMRSMHHLNAEDVEPNEFKTTSFGSATRFFSVQTAAAIEMSVKCKILPEWTLTTAHFIRLIDKWFTLVSSVFRKTSVTRRNKDEKLQFLESFIYLFQNIKLGKGWKPLNTGMILANLTFADSIDFIFNQDGFFFIPLHKFTKDAMAYTFSQVRRKIGQTPSSKEVLTGLGAISMSQFTSDVKCVNYLDETNEFSFDHFFVKNCENMNDMHSNNSSFLNQNMTTEMIFQTFTFNDDFSNYLNSYDLNVLFNIGSNAIATVIQKCCANCSKFLSLCSSKNVRKKFKLDGYFIDSGVSREPCEPLFLLYINCEIIYREYRFNLLHQADYNNYYLIDKIIKDIHVDFPLCDCDIKRLFVQHFFTIRSYAFVSLNANLRKRKLLSDSAIAKKKKI